MDWAVFVLFCWLIDLCTDMVKAGHSGQATLLATVAIIGGLVYIRFVREKIYGCNYCDSDEWVTLRTDAVQQLLDSGVTSDYHRNCIVVDEPEFKAVRKEFEEEFED